MLKLESSFFFEQVKLSFGFLIDKGFSFENLREKATFYAVDIKGKNVLLEISYDLLAELAEIDVCNINFIKNQYDFEKGAFFDYLIEIKNLRGDFCSKFTGDRKDVKELCLHMLNNNVRLLKKYAVELIEDKAEAFVKYKAR